MSAAGIPAAGMVNLRLGWHFTSAGSDAAHNHLRTASNSVAMDNNQQPHHQDILDFTDLETPGGVVAEQPAAERIHGFLDEMGEIPVAAHDVATRVVAGAARQLVDGRLNPDSAMRAFTATWMMLHQHAFRAGRDPACCLRVSPEQVVAGLGNALEPDLADLFLHTCHAQNIRLLPVQGRPLDVPPELTNAHEAAHDRLAATMGGDPETMRTALDEYAATHQAIATHENTCSGTFQPLETPLALAALTNAVACFMVGEHEALEGEARLGDLMGVMTMAARVVFARAGLVRAVAWPADHTYTCEFEVRDMADPERLLALPRDELFGRYSPCHYFGYLHQVPMAVAVVHHFVSQMATANDFDGRAFVFNNTISAGNGRLTRPDVPLDAEARLRANDCRVLSGLLCSLARVPGPLCVTASDMGIGIVDACALYITARLRPGRFGNPRNTDQPLLDPAWDGIVTQSAWHQDREFPEDPADVAQAIRAHAGAIAEFAAFAQQADPGHFADEDEQAEDEHNNNSA